jgi:hypothetical protein
MHNRDDECKSGSVVRATPIKINAMAKKNLASMRKRTTTLLGNSSILKTIENDDINRNFSVSNF